MVFRAYCWYGVLTDYDSGSVTIVAESVEQARELINKQNHHRYSREDLEVIMNQDPDIVEELPCIIESPGSA